MMWSPALAFCATCSIPGQLNEEMRAWHDCPTIRPRIEASFAAMMAEPPKVTIPPHIERRKR